MPRLVLLLTVLVSLSACGGDSEPEPQPESTPTSSLTELYPASPSMPQFESESPGGQESDSSLCIDLFPPAGITRPSPLDVILPYLFGEPNRRDFVQRAVDQVQLMVEVTASDTLRPSIKVFLAEAKDALALVDAGRQEEVDIGPVTEAAVAIAEACGDNLT